jgi:tRNA pseudouridine55 synthase
MNGALLLHKHEGVSSFGIIDIIQRQLMEKQGCKRRDLPKVGHGGTLDPFATGLLIILVGKGVKLARYFLGSIKEYEGLIRFGETTVPGDPTSPISETSDLIPGSIEEIRQAALKMTQEPYHQTPPMHSAKKKDGKPLYELARAGIEVERDTKLCHLYEFSILDYHPPKSSIRVKCSSGTYIRTLTQDFGKKLGTVALLETLHRTGSGQFSIRNAWSADQILEAVQSGKAWDELPCWIPFDQLLESYPQVLATQEERLALVQGRQEVLPSLMQRSSATSSDSKTDADCVAIYCEQTLVAVARREQGFWGIERVFT